MRSVEKKLIENVFGWRSWVRVKYFLEFNRIYGIFFISLQIEKKGRWSAIDSRRMSLLTSN